MKKLQGSAAAKVCAVIVLLAAAFSAGVFGVRTVLCAQSALGDSWQESTRFYRALEDRRRELMEGVTLILRIQELEERLANEEGSPMAYAELEALKEQREELEKHFSRENTWFRFRIINADTREVLGANLKDDEAILKAVREVCYQTFEVRGYRLVDGDSYYWSENGGDQQTDPPSESSAEDVEPPAELMLEYGVPESVRSSVQDEFYLIWQTWGTDRANFDQYLTGFLNLSALTLLALIWILWTAGHRNGTEGIVTTWQERIFFDVYAAVMIFVGVFLVFCTVWAANQTYFYSAYSFYWGNVGSRELYSPMGIMGTAALFTGAAACGTLLLRTFVVRLKARCLIETTLLCRVWRWTVRTVHNFVRFLPITWKTVLGSVVYSVFIFCLFEMCQYDGGVFLMIFFFLQLILLLFLSAWAYNYHRLRQGTKTIAKGNLEYQIDTTHMPYDLRMQAEDLNNISVGLSSAVDEKMKSERFKAELITNVSHDLKTPLTSIINYVNLLKSTEQSDPKAVEYIEVLDRKSQRLKKLTEDLVEASKASTGVLSVAREKIGMSQLIDQALGEWEEKLTARKLALVTTLPEGETWVYADGRHLWRVIDNLLSNCAKYAMEGTRVYLDLERGKGQVVLSVKNISREPLNVPAERLMERFVRGEESRSTEGSGLGLSIARSLTELQGGAFELAVDGDLFKAIVTLPQAN